ncbi:nuclear pore membrane glycoprotein 210-like isoform X2 [Festucalex cinctus]
MRFAFVLLSLIDVFPKTAYAKFNMPKVLLPLARATRINFTMETTEGGCYKWTSTRPEVVSVHPIDEETSRGCSRRAFLQGQSTQSSRLTSVIFAEDVVSRRVLRCDAIVDVICDIIIVSTARELYLAGSPLALEVNALDSEGNTFSTLAGMTFDWSLVKDMAVKGFSDSSDLLRFLKFSESTFTPPGYITEMERVAKQGNIILVSGLKIGYAKVKAKIQESLYHGVNATEVKLLIVENILLNPSHDVYLMVGTSIQYQVLRIKHGLINELPMPCEQYKLHLWNSVVDINGNPRVAVARLDQGTSTVTAIQLGYIKVVLEDKNLKTNGTFRLLNSTLSVVEPSYLSFKIHPGDSWILETGRDYDVVIEVFDKFDNKIYPSANIHIDSVFPLEYFNMFYSSLNGSYHHRVQPVEGGRTVIDATLVAFVDNNDVIHPLPNPIHGEQDVTIYYPIVLIPSTFIFPWHPKVGVCQYTIEATGGSGNFSWSSSNTSVVTVSYKGVMKTESDIGLSIINAHDMRNPLHFGTMQVYVVQPVAMDFAPCQVEARVGMILELPLRIYGLLEKNETERVMLTDCSHFDLKVNDENQGVFELLEDQLTPGQGYCSGLGAKALVPGHTTLSVSYTHVNANLSAKITIAAYPPLTAIDPVSVAVVTLGCSKYMLFNGGPRPWILEHFTFFRDVKAEDENIVGITLTNPLSHNNDKYLISATCRALGEQMLEVTVTNTASVTNPYPAVERTSVKFVCTPPSRFTLLPVYDMPQLEQLCPLLQQNNYMVPVSNHRNTVLNLVAFDQEGRKFDNFSSLDIVWKTNQESLASIEHTQPMTLQLFEDENKQMKLHGLQTIVVHRQSGIAAITVKALHYQYSHLLTAKIYNPVEKFAPLSVTLELKLVEDVKVFPNTLTIYNHPDVRGNLVLREGSGHFFVNTSAKDIAEVVLQDSKETVQVTTFQPGMVQVMVHDLCLAFPYAAKALVYVSDIREVNLRVIAKVGIGKSVRCYVRVLDDHKKPFPASYFQVMKLKVKALTEVVLLIPVADSTKHNTAVYLVNGVSVGQTTLYAVVVDKNENMLSASQQIEVFPPFNLIPRKMTLLIGGMMQITSEGGPQPQPSILFSISNEDIASVNRIGHVKGMTLGNVTVTGLVQTVDTETGKLFVMLKDQVEVEVVHLTAIRISAPITRIMTGMQMPVYVMGLSNSQTPFTFANALPSLTFHWSSTKRDILNVQSRHSMVYDKLCMLNPKVEAGKILMTLDSVLKLQTYWDGVGALSYQMLKYSKQVTVAQVDDKGLLFSGGLYGISSLLIASPKSFDVNRTLVIPVKVVPVSYVRFSTSPALYTYTGENVKYFPLGLVLTLTVHFHTSTGELLHSSKSHLTFSTNRDDLVQVIPGQGNHTLTVRMVNAGLTLLSVHDRDHTVMADYIPLPVAHAIQPAEAQTLVVGDVICFTAQLTSQDGGHGTWSSSADAVLQIDSKTGAAVARDNGVATVYYEIPGVVKAFREIVVESATKTVAMAQDGKTDVLLTTRGQGTNLIGICSSIQIEAIAQLQPETSVTCHISFTDKAVHFPASSVIETHVSFNSSNGLYTCSLTLQPMEVYQAEELNSPMTSLLVKAGLEGSTFSGEQVSATVRIEPGLYTDLPALTLSNVKPSVELTVFGPVSALADMEVISSSPVIGIQEIEAQRDFPSFTKYTIRLSDVRVAGSASIAIYSASTGQNLIIPVTLAYQGEPSGDIQLGHPVWVHGVPQRSIQSSDVLAIMLNIWDKALAEVDTILQTNYNWTWILWWLATVLSAFYISIRLIFLLR